MNPSVAKRARLFSTTVIVASTLLGGLLLVRDKPPDSADLSLTSAKAASRTVAVDPLPNVADFPICHTPAFGGTARAAVRLAQMRTEVPPSEMKAVTPAPDFADIDPPLWDGLGSTTYRITTSNSAAQAYFDQGLRLTYAFNHGEAQRAFRKAQKLDPRCAMCFWGEALVLGPNINLPMQDDAVAPAFAAMQKARALAGGASPRGIGGAIFARSEGRSHPA
jgi:hypothetical protein